ncbi:hypothetical protein Tco_0253298, partial [Tanacetum coccineum]
INSDGNQKENVSQVGDKKESDREDNIEGKEISGNKGFDDNLNGELFPPINTQYKVDNLGGNNDGLNQDIGDKDADCEKCGNRSDGSVSKPVSQDEAVKIAENGSDGNLGSNRGVWNLKFADMVKANKIDNKLMEISTEVSEDGKEVVVLNDEMIEE